MREFTRSQSVTHTKGASVVFLPVNHRGPLSVRALHSTDKTTRCAETLRDLFNYDPFTGKSYFTLLPEAVITHIRFNLSKLILTP